MVFVAEQNGNQCRGEKTWFNYKHRASFLMEHPAASFQESTHCKSGLYSRDALHCTMPDNQYNENRVVHIEMVRFIRQLCSHVPSKMLRVYQRVYSTAAIYYRRYYISNSINDMKHPPIMIAAVSVYLSSKVEGHLMHPKDIINRASLLVSFPYQLSQFLEAERELIVSLKKSLIVWHPETDCDRICTQSNLPEFFCETLRSILNDAYMTDVIVEYGPLEISLGCITVAGVLQNCDIRSVLCQTQYDIERVEAASKEILEYYVFTTTPEYAQKREHVRSLLGLSVC